MHTNPKSLTLFEFEQMFPDENACLRTLEHLKWKDGFHCFKCDHDKYCHGSQRLSRQCSRCRYIESPTANTIFHGIKFSLKKAFYIAYFTATNKKGISSAELSRKLGLRQKTCWLFRHKILTAMKQKKRATDENCEVQLGVVFTGKKGRKHQLKKKKQSLLSIEVKANKLFSIHAKKLKKRSKNEIANYIVEHYPGNVRIKSDQWPGASAALSTLQDCRLFSLKQAKKELRLLYRTRMMLMGWLRGTHGHAKYMQAYLDEYCFRMNYRYLGGAIFFLLLNRLMEGKPITYGELINYYSSA